MKKIFILIVASLSLVSCDMYSDYQMIIDNNTNDTVKIFLKGQTASYLGLDSIISKPNSQIVFYDNLKTRMKEWSCDPKMKYEETIVEISDNKILKKDITNKLNWSCNTDAKNTYWKLVFTIEQCDFDSNK